MLNKDRNTTRKATGQVAVLPVATGVKIYAGSLVCLNADGYAIPAADTAGFRLAGVSREYVDNSSGANGALSVQVWRDGVFDFAAAGMGADDVGKPVFIADDQTVALTSTNAVGAGIISEVESATKVWIDIAPANCRTGQAQDSITAAVAAGVTADDGTAATGEAPTKAEFDAVVTLANDCKLVINELLTLANDNKSVANGLLTKLEAARIIGS